MYANAVSLVINFQFFCSIMMRIILHCLALVFSRKVGCACTVPTTLTRTGPSRFLSHLKPRRSARPHVLVVGFSFLFASRHPPRVQRQNILQADRRRPTRYNHISFPFYRLSPSLFLSLIPFVSRSRTISTRHNWKPLPFGSRKFFLLPCFNLRSVRFRYTSSIQLPPPRSPLLKP